MSLGAKILVWVLAVVWLPVTQYCALDCAGLLPTTIEDGPVGCCDESNKAARYSCDSVERGSYVGSAQSIKVLAPDLLACACAHCLRLIEAQSLANCRVATGWLDAPSEWVVDWIFVRRAACPARAPALIA